MTALEPAAATPRARVDRCPGALVLHEAADGGLARVRLPGGLVDPAALVALTRLAESFGTPGGLELTSRGNAQLRGVPAGRRAELADEVAGLGLLPSATHERVRNIVASPCAGLLDARRPALDDLVRDLDRALCADPALAALPGRFLFGLDDGTGDIASLAPDAWAVPAGGQRWWVGPAAVTVERSAVVGELLAAARGFLAAAPFDGTPTPWRIRDLPDGGARLAGALRAGRDAEPCPVRGAEPRPVGVWRRPDSRHAGAVQVPLGRLGRTAAEMLAAACAPGGTAPLRVTPWRCVVVARVADPAAFADAARGAGLVLDPGSPWARVTACAGRPGCAHAQADVRTDAARAVGAGRPAPAGAPPGGAPALRVHWSGCARRCGKPAGRHVEVVATADGYRVRDTGADETRQPAW